MRPRLRLPLALLAALTVPAAVFAACGGGDDARSSSGSGSGAGSTSGGNDASTDRSDEDPVIPHAPSCAVASAGSSGPVQTPTLRATLAASWDENWLASPALVDVDGDGKLDVVAARHSVLYAWKGDGTPLWHAAFGSSASNSPDHGSSRMWASPVVGDLDGDGKVEISPARRAIASSGGRGAAGSCVRVTCP